jgi:hypothetical protein
MTYDEYNKFVRFSWLKAVTNLIVTAFYYSGTVYI